MIVQDSWCLVPLYKLSKLSMGFFRRLFIVKTFCLHKSNTMHMLKRLAYCFSLSFSHNEDYYYLLFIFALANFTAKVKSFMHIQTHSILLRFFRRCKTLRRGTPFCDCFRCHFLDFIFSAEIWILHVNDLEIRMSNSFNERKKERSAKISSTFLKILTHQTTETDYKNWGKNEP